MALRSRERDPWRHAPVGELQEQLLPRWFVLLAVGLVPVAVVVLVAAFLVGAGGDDVAVAQRRPPPSDGLTTDVGDLRVGATEPQPWARACARLEGVQVAGSAQDRALLRRGLAGLCTIPLPDDVVDRLERFADAGGVVRFAQFAATGVDSAADLDAEPPVVYVNARFSRTTPRWIAPLVAHDTTYLDADPTTAEGALAARRAQLAVCDVLLAGERPSRGCTDAAALFNAPDPLADLRAAGFH